MNSRDQPKPPAHLLRREFLEHLAAAGVAVSWPSLAKATTEVWEEGDPLCTVADPPLEKPDGYELDRLYLGSFVELSERLTGVAPLDRQLANEYMERFATNRQLTTNLDLMIQAYRNIRDYQRRSESDVKQQILLSPEKKVRAAAQQLIFLWYVSAFYIPIPDPSSAAPLEDGDTRKKVWIYGTPEQYGRAILWSVIRAHAPMTPGGPANYWASAPATY